MIASLPPGVRANSVTLTARQRQMLSRLLNGEAGKLPYAALETLRRLNWVLGAEGGFQLTALGRQLAEESDASPPGVPLVVSMR